MNYSITEKHADKVLTQYKKEEGQFYIDHFFNRDSTEKIVDMIYRVVGTSTPEEIRIRFNQNLDLMLLHYNTIPDAIQKQIYKQVESDLGKLPNSSKLVKMEYILEGTEWMKQSTGTPAGYDPFANLNISETKKEQDSKITNELF